MTDVYFGKGNTPRGRKQDLIFIGSDLTIGGYGIAERMDDGDYFVVDKGCLSGFVDDIRKDKHHIKTALDERLLNPVIQEIEKLGENRETSRGLTKEVKRLLEILPKPSLN